MKTIVLDEPERLRLTDTEEPASPGPGEALVRVRRIGICGSDYHAYRGRQPFFSYPRILGHELGVEVLELGSPCDTLGPGDKCAVEPYLNCGVCIACRAGRTNCCVSLKVLGVHTDGGMRERILVPTAKLHKSETLNLNQLALVETLGIGAHAVDRAAVTVGENVLVIGAGPIGLTVIQFAQAAGAHVYVSDINEGRLAFCRDQLKVAGTLGPGANGVAEVQSAIGGELPLVVFDATGNKESMQGAFQYAASGGRVVFVGLFLGDVAFYDPDFHRKELTLLATRNSTGADFKRILGLLESGDIDVEPWVTHHAAFEDLAGAFPSWLDPAHGVIKAIVTTE